MAAAQRLSLVVDPRDLINHHKHIELYGDGVNPDLKASVERVGRILHPILVAADGKTVVSGRSRKTVAVNLGHKEVPIIVDPALDNEADIVIALIESNTQREKTTEQKAREFKALKEAYEKKNAAPSGESEKAHQSTAHVEAAKKVGLSPRSAHRAERVIEKIDEYKAAGKTEKAEKLSETLNHSIDGAVKQMTRKASTTKDARKLILEAEKAANLVAKVAYKAERAHGGPSVYSKAVIEAVERLNEKINDWLNDL